MDIETLKQILEKRSGHSITSASDCEWIVNDIQSKTHETISRNTVKRLLGFLPYSKTHRESTLDIIAHYIGYGSWKELENSKAVAPSDFGNDIKVLNVADLKAGSIVEITYKPGRSVRFRYEGDCRFTVIGAENSKLCVGDKLHISQFAIGFPLLASDVIRGEESLGEYSAAKIGGLSTVKWK